MSTDITIEHIANSTILTCPPDTRLSEAARRMTEAHCSSILVVHDDEIIGIWTERDALALDMSDTQAFQSPIAQHMASPVKTIHHGIGLGEAALRFREEKVRHLLVVDDAGEPRGIVTQTDVVLNQGIEYYLSLREVKSVLNSQYPLVASTASLDEAVQKMRLTRLDAVIAGYPDGSHGILTERDVMHLVSGSKALAAVGELASRPLICVAGNSSLYHARTVFMERQIRHLGVTGSDGRLLGLITFSSLLSNIEHDYVRQLRETLKERERRLAISQQHERLAAKVFESTLEGVIVTDARRVIESVNPAFTQITGFTADEVIGKTPSALASGRHDALFYRKMQENLATKGYWRGEIWNRRRSGEIYPEWLTISSVRNDAGQLTHYVGMFSDITKRKATEEQMAFLAYHDSLTQLPNRGLFIDRLHHAIAHAHRNQEKVAVMFLDLDHFKSINDNLGHHIGDQLLQVMAQRLMTCVREDDTVARLGGDEFTVILESIAHADDVPRIAQKIVDTLSQPMQIDGHDITVTASVGISLYPTDSEQADDLIKCADTAMYMAKQGGRRNFQLFAAAMTGQARPPSP